MNINYFAGVNTIEELKQAYRKLAKQFHPDLNLDRDTTQEMKDVNNEYDYLFPRLVNKKDTSAGHKVDDNFRSIIDALLQYEITIEVVGSWVWVSGDTYAIKDQLKALGFKWSKNNKKWYLGEYSSKKKGSMSWQQKVDTFGVTAIKKSEKQAIKPLLIN